MILWEPLPFMLPQCICGRTCGQFNKEDIWFLEHQGMLWPNALEGFGPNTAPSVFPQGSIFTACLKSWQQWSEGDSHCQENSRGLKLNPCLSNWTFHSVTYSTAPWSSRRDAWSLFDVYPFAKFFTELVIKEKQWWKFYSSKDSHHDNALMIALDSWRSEHSKQWQLINSSM